MYTVSNDSRSCKENEQRSKRSESMVGSRNFGTTLIAMRASIAKHGTRRARRVEICAASRNQGWSVRRHAAARLVAQQVEAAGDDQRGAQQGSQAGDRGPDGQVDHDHPREPGVFERRDACGRRMFERHRDAPLADGPGDRDAGEDRVVLACDGHPCGSASSVAPIANIPVIQNIIDCVLSVRPEDLHDHRGDGVTHGRAEHRQRAPPAEAAWSRA